MAVSQEGTESRESTDPNLEKVEGEQSGTHALVEAIINYAWVVGPRYDGKTPKACGYTAVKRWNVIGLDGEDEYTVTADTPEELLAKIKKFEADAETKMLRAEEAAKAKGA